MKKILIQALITLALVLAASFVLSLAESRLQSQLDSVYANCGVFCYGVQLGNEVLTKDEAIELFSIGLGVTRWLSQAFLIGTIVAIAYLSLVLIALFAESRLPKQDATILPYDIVS